MDTARQIRVRQKLGKYIIEKKLGEGGFAAVYRALDTIEGIRVALKIPYPQYVGPSVLDSFRREVRLIARLNHPHILSVKNAEFIDGHFVIAMSLGERSLADRLCKRLSSELALEFTRQILEAVAYAHQQRIIHCDIKPENLILFPEQQLKLTDFGIARVAQRTVQGSGSGTVGYVAPEQAMGKPSFRSDVFSIGLIVYRMVSGHLPEYPFDWPPEGIERVQERFSASLLEWLKKSMDPSPKRRFEDAQQMLNAYRRIRKVSDSCKRLCGEKTRRTNHRDWRTVRFRQFRQQYGETLELIADCDRCQGPVAEAMIACPWCGADRQKFMGETRFPLACPRCYRGLKLDWPYCPWCYGAGFDVTTNRNWGDKRYVAQCGNSACQRKQLMPFMRYCPWCRRKVRRKWGRDQFPNTCGQCGWGVAADFWNQCPWCRAEL